MLDMEAEPLAVADLIRSKRQQLGLSARALSARAHQSAGYVSKLEAGEIQPSFQAFAAIATVLRFSALELELAVRIETVRARSRCHTP